MPFSFNTLANMFNERVLVTQLQQGHKESFTPLYDEYFQVLYNHIFYKTLDQNLTEDITSESFFKAFDKIDKFTYTREGSFKSRLYTIANNLLIDHWKKRKLDQFEENFEPIDEQSITKDEQGRYLYRELMTELNKLDAQQKEIIIMRLWEGLSYDEVESITGRASTSLRKDFSTAIKNLKTLSQHLGISFGLVLLHFLGQM